jgi:hypothetical protein
MGYYQAFDFNSIAPGSYDPTKGNSMVATTNRPKGNNQSQWEVGVADGWNMPGSFIALKNNVNLPALALGEVFAASTLQDVHPDGTEPGYGVEFAIPWRYLGMYSAAGLDLTTSLTYQNVFTYHVSLVGGNSGIDGAEDNAGGCCAGVVASTSPDVSVVGPSTMTTSVSNNSATGLTKINIQNNVAAITTVFPVSVTLSNITPGPVSDPATEFTVRVYNSNAAGDLLAPIRTLVYDGAASGGGSYVFKANTLQGQNVASLSNIYFVVEVTQSPKIARTFNQETKFTAEIINTNTSECLADAIAIDETDLTEANIPLPVHFKSFTANRSNASSVSINWTTASEQNSKGFYVQKNVNGEWKNVAYVASQAVNGNSSSDLNYSYTDANTEKGITQYRILQVDLDGKSKYSDIRAIRGDGNLAKVVVYPNPSTDGKVNIVFEDNSSLRDVIVNDMQGKVIRSFRGVSNNILVIEKLTTGFYTIKVSNRTTSASSVHKVVIK